jgi:integrase/recombinase XerD
MEVTLPASCAAPPDIILAAGDSARFAWEEFFYGRIRSVHKRRAYFRAVRGFLKWCDIQHIPLQRISPANVGLYLHALSLSLASKKQVLAGLRHFFDSMVVRHAIALNPALSVRTERYSVLEGKTPEISINQARRLLASIDVQSIVGLRDKCIISILIYTAARVGAVAKLRMKDCYDAEDQYCLHFIDKGGKSREIPLRHDLQVLLLEFLRYVHLVFGRDREQPLFTTAFRRTKNLTRRKMSDSDIGRMVKRRMKAAGLPDRLSPHSFRVATITDRLTQGVPLEDVQHLAGHADPRTTRLYDRRQKKVTRNIVERISI